MDNWDKIDKHSNCDKVLEERNASDSELRSKCIQCCCGGDCGGSNLNAGVSLSLGASTSDEVSDENDNDEGSEAGSDDNWDNVAGTGVQVADLVDLVGREGSSIEAGEGDHVCSLDVDGRSSNKSELGGRALVSVGLSGGDVSWGLLVHLELSEEWDQVGLLGLERVVDNLEGFVARRSKDNVKLPFLGVASGLSFRVELDLKRFLLKTRSCKFATDVQGLDRLVVPNSLAVSVDFNGFVDSRRVLLSGVLLVEDQIELEVSVEDYASESGVVAGHVEVLSGGDGQQGCKDFITIVSSCAFLISDWLEINIRPLRNRMRNSPNILTKESEERFGHSSIDLVEVCDLKKEYGWES